MRRLNAALWPIVMAGALVAMIVVAPAAYAQDANGGDEPSESQIRRHYSLYAENYNNENYARAAEDVEWILENAPGFPNDTDLNFRRAVRIYEALIEESEDAESRQEYAERAWEIYDGFAERFEELGLEYDEFAWTRNKGRFIEVYGDELDELPVTAREVYEEAFELDADRLEPYYINQIIQGYLAEGDEEGALAFMDQVEAERGDNAEIRQMITDAREELFDSPEERYEFLETRLAEEPDNVELLREQFSLAQQLGHRQEMYDIAERLLELEPSAESYLQVAEMYLDDGEEQQALTYLQRALEQEDIDEGTLRRDVYYNMGVAERRDNNLQQARNYMRQALDVDSNYGRAYIGIAEVYANAVSECSGGTLERQDRAVYWLVIDYLQRAASVDPSLASTVDQQVRTYQQVMPSQEDVFFHPEWEEGATVSINFGCYSWINETTTARAVPQ